MRVTTRRRDSSSIIEERKEGREKEAVDGLSLFFFLSV